MKHELPKSEPQAAGPRGERPPVSVVRRERFREVLTRASSAVLAAWLVLGLELGVVLVFGGAAFASVWEVQFGGLWLAPTALGLGGALGLAGALLRFAIERESRFARYAVSAVVFACAAVTGWGLGGGRLLASLVRRGGFALLVGVAAALVVWWLAPRLRRALNSKPLWVSGAVVLLILLLEIANARILVRLYPAFHWALSAICLVLAPFALHSRARLESLPGGNALGGSGSSPGAASGAWPGTRLRSGVVLGLLLASLALAPLGAARLAHFDNFRLVLSERAPLLGHAVHVASVLSPPPPIREDCGAGGCWEPARVAGGGVTALDFRGQDLLLISIDALRADHVGSYGYSRPTTPNLDELARGGNGYSGVLFDYAYCPTPHTSYSVTSLMTGKFMRPLLLQGAGEDSDTWAKLLRSYGFHTAAFYPPAVFFIDKPRFEGFQRENLGFEYVKQEFLEGPPRVKQVVDYLDQQAPEQRVFLWVHLFGPHEPYVAHPGLGFGDRDIDRYDSEIAAADRSVGQIVQAMRSRRPGSVVILTSDHGEEFGDHGGRYHGTSVYEEQVRVPLIFSIPEDSVKTPAFKSRRVSEVVQTIDLLPTVLSALDVPVPPRVRGRDLSPVIASEGKPGQGVGFALVETEAHSLLAEGTERLICERRLGACQLFDLAKDPKQQHPVADPARRAELQGRLRRLGESHGRFEQSGQRAEGKGWPAPILRGISGDGDAALEIAELLDDADLEIRQKAAELLFELRRPETASSLELALRRDEDPTVKGYSALALTRLGRGAPLSFELMKSTDKTWRRLAALALAESGDKRGEAELIAWWKATSERDFERSLELLAAFGALKSEDAVWPLVLSLSDVRLRPHIATALAQIGEEVARAPLAKALSKERYQSARVSLARALVDLGAEAELVPAFVRFLGVPDPLDGGVGLAVEAKILDRLGGPEPRVMAQLTRQSHLGVAFLSVVPKGGNGSGVRVLIRAKSQQGGQVYVASEQVVLKYSSRGEPRAAKDVPRLDRDRLTLVDIPASPDPTESWARLSDSIGARPGKPVRLVVFAERQVEILGFALVPLADELPPPAPKPWKPEAGASEADPGGAGG